MLDSLQKRYTFIIIVLTMLSLSFLLFIDYLLLRSHSIERAKDTSMMVISNVDAQIDLLIGSLESTLTALSAYDSVQEVDTEDMKNQFLAHVQADEHIIRAIYLGTSEGEMYEWGVGEGFTDNTPSFAPGYDPRTRPWYQIGLASDTFTLSDPYLYASTDALGITGVKKVYDEGNLVGVLGLDIILDGLNNMVNLVQTGQGGKIVLLTEDGEELANQFHSGSQAKIELSLFPYPEILSSTGPSVHEIYGAQYMVHHKKSAKTGWTILIALPFSEILAFSLMQRQIIIFYDIIVMLLLGIIVAFISKRLLTDPLHEIISVLKAHEGGEYDSRIRVQSVPEFQMIAQTFNTVAENKKEREKQMETEVEHRTREVLLLQKENMRLRIIEEKERIYTTLHDSLGARLTSIHISNNVARHAVEIEDITKVRQMLDRIEYNTAKGIHDLKDILEAKEEDSLPEGYFTHFVTLHIARRLSVRSIAFSFSLPEEQQIQRISDETLISLSLILEELVTNSLKYSHAHTVQITLSLEDKEVLLTYVDDGIGFDVRKAKKGGFGIPGIFHRAEYLGGFVQLTSKTKKGVRYNIHIPRER
ncbi:MAG: hypothetical protein JXK93_12695 [Sphaerochaetaceae bacterium]|nr:hypothetical protein [Sphaerochaetaceae bacterium]